MSIKRTQRFMKELGVKSIIIKNTDQHLRKIRKNDMKNLCNEFNITQCFSQK